MNAALELHDSNVSTARADGDTLRLHLSAGYIHRSEGRPGIDPGSGWVQPVVLVFSGASWHGLSSECTGYLSSGTLTLGDETMSLIPLPYNVSGGLIAEFVFVSGAILSVSAQSVTCACVGEPCFVEFYGG